MLGVYVQCTFSIKAGRVKSFAKSSQNLQPLYGEPYGSILRFQRSFTPSHDLFQELYLTCLSKLGDEDLAASPLGGVQLYEKPLPFGVKADFIVSIGKNMPQNLPCVRSNAVDA